MQTTIAPALAIALGGVSDALTARVMATLGFG